MVLNGMKYPNLLKTLLKFLIKTVIFEYMLEVVIKYSEQLNMSHNGLSFLSEKMKFKKKKGKLIHKRKDKEKYTLHVRNVKSKS